MLLPYWTDVSIVLFAHTFTRENTHITYLVSCPTSILAAPCHHHLTDERNDLSKYIRIYINISEISTMLIHNCAFYVLPSYIQCHVRFSVSTFMQFVRKQCSNTVCSYNDITCLSLASSFYKNGAHPRYILLRLSRLVASCNEREKWPLIIQHIWRWRNFTLWNASSLLSYVIQLQTWKWHLHIARVWAIRCCKRASCHTL